MLIADGDGAVRQRLFSRLLDADIYSDCVSNVGDALKKLEETTYAIVLLDIELPGDDAVRIVNYIETMTNALRPVVLVLASNPEAARTLQVEVVQIVLRKPAGVGQLTDLIRNCMRTLSARRNDVPPQAPADPLTT
ncbi:MAG TPA: response regulator [Thermoanaerobaculia bacterium]|nr:response regulator [Thermoanaerobaculia bacterium]